MDVYIITLTDGTVQTFTTKEYNITETDHGMRMFNTETWECYFFPYTSIKYYRRERVE